jgi:DNA-binding NtrC family response regulator
MSDGKGGDVTRTLHTNALTAGRAASFEIVVERGVDAGRRVTVDPSSPTRLLVGQGPACGFRLQDVHVSRRHAAFEIESGRLRIVDLGSKNGTVVDGVACVDAFLSGGEAVRIGDSVLRVTRSETAEGPRSTEMRYGRMVGGSDEIRRLYPLCERLAASTVPVLIEGETGTGKEQLAEALHEEGPRAAGPFVVFDCTAVPPNLLESVLFGHEKGAFTGATSTRRGVFEQAHGGTLLVDEVGDLELSLQPKLLRALERGEVQRVGSDRWLRVDVRVLAATRRDLDREVQEGRFRDDLFFRIAVTRIEIPPLRRRRSDIALLARHFWRKLGGRERPFPEALIPRLEAYDWPGNVRELRNAIARRLALGELASIAMDRDAGTDESVPPPPDPSRAPDWIDQVVVRDLPFPRARAEVVEEFERRYIAHVLERHGGNVAQAAAASGIARRYFRLIRSRHK